jgi:hypothetical protein
MTKAPIVLHTQASLACMNFEETATEVQLTAPGAAAFAPPAGITFKPDPYLRNVDSMAHGYVGYLASQQLTDSIAKAKAEMAQAGGAQANPQQMTPEQKQSMQQACEALKSIDLNKVMADAANAFERAMVEAMKNEAKNQATGKLKGLLKKPRIP